MGQWQLTIRERLSSLQPRVISRDGDLGRRDANSRQRAVAVRRSTRGGHGVAALRNGIDHSPDTWQDLDASVGEVGRIDLEGVEVNFLVLLIIVIERVVVRVGRVGLSRRVDRCGLGQAGELRAHRGHQH